MLFNDYLYRIKTTEKMHDPLRVFVSDKEYVKIFVKSEIGDQYNVPTVAVLHTADDARAYHYPPTCCIKPTHLSGEVILRSEGSPVDLDRVASWFSRSHYRSTRESNYRHLRPKVIVEPIVFGDSNVADYKIFCFRAQARLIQLDLDRRSNHTRKFYDRNWNELPFSLGYPRSLKVVERPRNLESMLKVAEALSARFGLIRIDLYSNDEQCLVGEITNCHGNAGEQFFPTASEEAASRILFGTDFQSSHLLNEPPFVRAKRSH